MLPHLIERLLFLLLFYWAFWCLSTLLNCKAAIMSITGFFPHEFFILFIWYDHYTLLDLAQIPELSNKLPISCKKGALESFFSGSETDIFDALHGFLIFFCCIAMHHQWMFLLIWWESLLLPACEFGGEFAEQVRSGPAADIRRQGSSIMAEGGRRGRRSIGGRDTVTELTPVEGATDGGSTCQPTALTWGRGGGCSRSDNTDESGGREGGGETGSWEETETDSVNARQTVHWDMQHSVRACLCLWMYAFVTCCLCRSAAASVGQCWNDLYIRTCFCGS